ncbi:MAG: tetratricopeptide repeat protein [Parasphingorhabdus sp.]|uniref:tetratricopeptide repeat protein n=1 Tax=Parasphingorhabdus sp. TaxID=2709688 RepID=UPI00300336EC
MLSIVLVMVTACTSSEVEASKLAAQAQSYLEQKRIAEARIAIKQAVSKEDDVPEYHILQGRIEYAADANESAFSAYSEALAFDTTNQEALQAVSQIGLQIGRWRESLDATDKLLVLNPNQENALLVRGLHALIKRDFDDADAYANKLLAADAENEGGAVLKARASFLAGKLDESIQILDKQAASRPNTTAIALTRLEIYRELRNAVQIEKQFIDLRKLQPDDLSIRVDEANFRYKTGKKNEATGILAAILANKKASIETIASSIDLWREYSVSRLNRDLASKIIQSGKSQARIAASRYFADSGDRATAVRMIDGMSGPEADAERANIALLNGNKALAHSLSKSILALDDTHCAALGTQAQFWLKTGKANAALRFAQRAVSECPGNVNSWEHAAMAYSKLGKPVNARRVYRQGLDANKQNEPLTRKYAEWLLANGKRREAVATAKRLTQSAPSLNSGWRLYTEICTKTRSDCVTQANRGLADSKTRYGIDLLPGELAPNGLFGRFVTR